MCQTSSLNALMPPCLRFIVCETASGILVRCLAVQTTSVKGSQASFQSPDEDSERRIEFNHKQKSAINAGLNNPMELPLLESCSLAFLLCLLVGILSRLRRLL